MWAIFKERNPSTSNHPHQRKLRRSIGSQPVGSVVGPRQPEVGIAGQVIPSQSPRRTFRSSDDGDLATWRLGDLATWRLGELASWRSGDLAIWRSGDVAIWRSGDLAIWRSGDLAIWRSGDLAIWSRVTTGFRPAHSSPASTSASPPPFVRTSGGPPQPHLRTTPSPFYLEQPSKRLLRFQRFASSFARQIPPPAGCREELRRIRLLIAEGEKSY
jgi:hypothetical protein